MAVASLFLFNYFAEVDDLSICSAQLCIISEQLVDCTVVLLLVCLNISSNYGFNFGQKYVQVLALLDSLTGIIKL